MSDGCSVPRVLRDLIPDLEAMCALCRPECLEHDEAFYYGGTFDEFMMANTKLYNGILPKLRTRYGPQEGERWAVLWYGAVQLGSWSSWTTGHRWDGRAFHQQAMEAP